MTSTTTPEYGSLREKIAAEKEARLARYAEFERIYALANVAGYEAAGAVVPVPMHVVQRANPLDDNSPIVKRYETVMDGVCGFAWVTVRPANCSFAIWAKKNKGWRTAYNGGVQLWVSDFDQSMTRKEAYASAFATVLRENGIERAYPGSRMD
jgi:hypothetical protein